MDKSDLQPTTLERRKVRDLLIKMGALVVGGTSCMYSVIIASLH